jgi:hypothetical protein
MVKKKKVEKKKQSKFHKLNNIYKTHISFKVQINFKVQDPLQIEQLLPSKSDVMLIMYPEPIYKLVQIDNTFLPITPNKEFNPHKNSAFLPLYILDIRIYNIIIKNFELFNKEIENLKYFLSDLFEVLVIKSIISNNVNKKEFDSYKELMLLKLENAKNNIIKIYLYNYQVNKDIDKINNSNVLKANVKKFLDEINNKHINSTLIFSDFFEWFEGYNYNPISITKFMLLENLTDKYFEDYFGFLPNGTKIIKIKNMFILWIKFYVLKIIDVNFEEPLSVWGFNSIIVLNRELWDMKIKELAKQMVRNRENKPAQNPIFTLYEIMQSVGMVGKYKDSLKKTADCARNLGHDIYTFNLQAFKEKNHRMRKY